MNSIDINNAKLLDNPSFFGLGSENYIQADGMGELEYFLLRRDVYLDGVKIYKVGQLIRGVYLGDNLVKVTLTSKLQTILGKKSVKLHIPKDIVKAEFFKADGNDTDMGMADMLCEEVSSNVDGAIANPTLAEETTTTVKPSTTSTATVATTIPVTTLVGTTTKPTETAILPKSPIVLSSVKPRTIVPTEGSTTVRPRSITPLTVTPITTTTPTTIITPAILTSIPANAIMPYAQEVVPAVTSMPSGGGGGGGGGVAEDSSAEQKSVDATKKTGEVEKRILGVKSNYVYAGGGLILLAAIFVAYKKGLFNGILNK